MTARRQLRIYRIQDGRLADFVQGWRHGVRPLRERMGFRVEGAWTIPDEHRFVWILAYDGPEDWDEKNRAYYESPERRTLSPDPADLIEEQQTWMLEALAEGWTGYRSADLAEIERQRARSGEPYLEFIRSGSLSVGLYVLPAGGVDRQRPHLEDEVYHVVSGRATLTVTDEEVRVGPGSVVFVEARAEHRFHDIEEELRILVFFSPPESKPAAG